MGNDKVSRLRADWSEIRPAVYEKKGYSKSEAERLIQRPDGLIRSALSASKKIADEKPKRS
jgi:hypothetical protein